MNTQTPIRQARPTTQVFGNSSKSQVAQQGIGDECTVISFLREKGFKVEVCPDKSRQFKDIDIVLNDVPVSIKSEHSGDKYRNIYFELLSQKHAPSEQGYAHYVTIDQAREVRRWRQKTGHPIDSLDYLKIHPRNWYAGYWYWGQADQYLIWQGNSLYLYESYDLGIFVGNHGWDKVLPLSAGVADREGGLQTICGFLNRDQIEPSKIWTLDRNR